MYNTDGLGGPFLLSTDSPLIANQPYLFEFQFDLTAQSGLIVKFKLEATNAIGSTLSDNYLAAIVAGLPGTPTSRPLKLSASTNSTNIGVQMPTVTNDGGSPIQWY